MFEKKVMPLHSNNIQKLSGKLYSIGCVARFPEAPRDSHFLWCYALVQPLLTMNKAALCDQ